MGLSRSDHVLKDSDALENRLKLWSCPCSQVSNSLYGKEGKFSSPELTCWKWENHLALSLSRTFTLSLIWFFFNKLTENIEALRSGEKMKIYFSVCDCLSFEAVWSRTTARLSIFSTHESLLFWYWQVVFFFCTEKFTSFGTSAKRIYWKFFYKTKKLCESTCWPWNLWIWVIQLFSIKWRRWRMRRAIKVQFHWSRYDSRRWRKGGKFKSTDDSIIHHLRSDQTLNKSDVCEREAQCRENWEKT